MLDDRPHATAGRHGRRVDRRGPRARSAASVARRPRGCRWTTAPSCRTTCARTSLCSWTRPSGSRPSSSPRAGRSRWTRCSACAPRPPHDGAGAAARGAAPAARVRHGGRRRATTTSSSSATSSALGEDLRAPALAQGRAGARTARSASRSSAPGMSGLVAAHRLHQAGRRGRGAREERRRRRHLARELLPRLPRRRLQPLLLLLVRAARRLAAALLARQEVLLDYFRGVADQLRAATAHPLRHRGARRRARRGDDALAAASCAGRTARGHRSRPTPSSAASASSTARTSPTCPAPTLRRPRRSTPPAGTTTSTSPGKRVAVIGTGASAAQFIPRDRRGGRPPHDPPAHARPGSSPRPTTTTPSSREVAWLLRNVPGYANWLPVLELLAERRGPDGRRARVDPEWDDGGQSVEPDQRAGPPALRRPPAGRAGRPPRPARRT